VEHAEVLAWKREAAALGSGGRQPDLDKNNCHMSATRRICSTMAMQ
jgi:hypothetical protein